ncbi:MAG: FecR domain-containing protein [Candidatus Pedobacter colombiensis]|uniref:FecR domain-containing protein n=1 Tax=Candidatus Pedobacter colombiensis TaxID=3121371 RepID=A0AAJ6B589_9SPHI|nr:FecR domain-containing protein [Pedobacter sp.]WEK18482.1 MAG: FecR domain-containing protein [Pedobacter sp.]
MDQNNKHINWDDLLTDLENDQSDGKLLTSEEQELLTELLAIKAEASDVLENYKDYHTKEHWQEMKMRIDAQEYQRIHRKRFKLWLRIAAAAVILLVLGVGMFYFNKPQQEEPILAALNDTTLIKQGATLTLANGKKIKLSSETAGELAKEAGVTITKTEDGQLNYEIQNSGSDNNRINTLSTSRGETYIVTLPDKSKVWLNAASSLTYSVSLNDNGKRLVKLKGEAYFEVSKDKAHPFIVKTDKQEVEVLGTSFNINAYSSKIQTTLVAGRVSVDIEGEGKQLILIPGQQANFDKIGGSLEKREVDVFPYVAWKDGLFVYQNVKMVELMDDLGRQYDYEIVFKNQSLKDLHFTGRADKSESIQSILDIIAITSDLKFTIKGRSIIVERSTQR